MLLKRPGLSRCFSLQRRRKWTWHTFSYPQRYVLRTTAESKARNDNKFMGILLRACVFFSPKALDTIQKSAAARQERRRQRIESRSGEEGGGDIGDIPCAEIERQRGKNGITYVHCRAGHSRGSLPVEGLASRYQDPRGRGKMFQGDERILWNGEHS